MNPTYFIDLEISGKDENDNLLEISEVLESFPNGNWVIDLSQYEGAYIFFNDEKYIKVFFNNEISRLYMFHTETEYRIYGITIRQIS